MREKIFSTPFFTPKEKDSCGVHSNERNYQTITVIKKIPVTLSFTLIRKYSQQLSTNADRQGANRELITFNSGRLSVFLSSLCYAVERHF